VAFKPLLTVTIFFTLTSLAAFFWNPATGELRHELPPSTDDTRGGILADEMVP